MRNYFIDIDKNWKYEEWCDNEGLGVYCYFMVYYKDSLVMQISSGNYEDTENLVLLIVNKIKQDKNIIKAIDKYEETYLKK